MKKIFLPISALMALTSIASAQDKWTGGTDNAWATGTNWFDTTAPALGTDVQFFGGYDVGGVGYADPSDPSSTFDVTNVTPINIGGTHTGSILINSLTSYTIAAGAGSFTPGNGKTVTAVNGSHTISETIRYDGTSGGTNFDIQTGAFLTASSLDAGGGTLRKSGAGTLITTGDPNNTAGINLLGGTLDIRAAYSANDLDPDGGSNAMLDGAAGTIVTKTTAGVVTLSVGTNSATASTADKTGTYDGDIRGNLNFLARGGTQTLTGTNTYAGTTSVANASANLGTLLVNGDNSGAEGNVSVSIGASLGGTGTLGGATTIDGILAPGVSGIQKLTIDNDVTWNDNDAWKFELGTSDATLALANAAPDTANDRLYLTGGTDSDFLKGTGTTFTFDFLGTGSAGWYKLVDWTGTTASTFANGDFVATGLSGSLSGSFVVDDTTQALYVNVVPEPTTWTLSALGLATTLGFRRRRSLASWYP